MTFPSGTSVNDRVPRTARVWVAAGILLVALALLFLPHFTGWMMALLVPAVAAASALLFSYRRRLTGTPQGQSRDDMEASVRRFQELEQELAKRDVVLDRLSRDLQLTRRSQEQFLALLNREIRVPLEGLLEMTGLLLDSDLDARAQREGVIYLC